MVVYMVLCHWVSVVAEAEGGGGGGGSLEGFYRDVKHMVAYFCADDGLIAST